MATSALSTVCYWCFAMKGFVPSCCVRVILLQWFFFFLLLVAVTLPRASDKLRYVVISTTEDIVIFAQLNHSTRSRGASLE